MSRKRSTSFPQQLIARFPVTLSAADLLAPASGGGDEELPEPIAFDPVPRLRNRRNGWTEQAQRDFIACLQLTGSISTSARAVGMSVRSAYRLLHSDGADSFAEAWDKAFEEGLARLRANAMDRALNGSLVPVYRRGRLVRVEHRRNDRLAIALLGGRDRSVDDHRRSAVSRRKYWTDMRALDEQRAEEERRREEARRAYGVELQRMLDKARSMRGPRIRSL
jgi:hypothetical protein